MNSGQRTTYPAQRGILGGFFAVKQQEGDPGLNRPLRGGVVASEEHEIGGHADHWEKERRVRPAGEVGVALCASGWTRGRMPLPRCGAFVERSRGYEELLSGGGTDKAGASSSHSTWRAEGGIWEILSLGLCEKVVGGRVRGGQFRLVAALPSRLPM